MKFLAASLGSFLLVTALPARAQSPAAGKPADSPAKAPAAGATPEKKPKKVWTNDEIGSVKGTVSVVGDNNSSSSSSTSSPDSHLVDHQRKFDWCPPKHRRPSSRIQYYQEQIDAIR